MTSSRFAQTGATLITVLIMLLLITIVGTYAMSQGMINLRVATNSQIQKLLMQSSDVALNSLEKNFALNQNVRLDATPVGQILLPGNEDWELQFCFKPSELNATNTLTNASFFDLTEYRIVQRKDNTATGVSDAQSGDKTKGYCDIDTMFAIGRKAVVTQIALSQPDDLAGTTKKYQLSAKKTDLKQGNTEVKRVKVTVTSLSPSLAVGVDDDQIKTCLSDRMMDATAINNLKDGSTKVAVETVDQCLRNLGVPVNSQVSEYVVNLDDSSSNL